MKKVILMMVLLQILSSCSESTSSNEKKHYGVPTHFPLETGNAWIYERHKYESGTDSMALDTLYIFGMHDDYYKYSWRPDEYYSLVKNQDNKLLHFGQVTLNDPPDTNIYDKPNVWAFYKEDTGYVDLEGLREFYTVAGDCLHIRIEKNIEKFTSLYDAYVTARIDINEMRLDRDQFSTVAGFDKWIYYNLNSGEMLRKTEMIRRLTNYSPPQNQMNKAGRIKSIRSRHDRSENRMSPDEH